MYTKKVLVCIFFIISLFQSVFGQKAEGYFISMPDSLGLNLEISRRLDLIDLYEAGMAATTKNSLNGEVKLDVNKDNYVRIINENQTVEIVLLSLINESQVICIIETLCSGICDSNIKFFSTNWKPLNSSLFFTPESEDRFFDKQACNVRLDVSFMEYHYNNETNQLVQTCNTLDFLSKEDKKAFTPYLKEKTKSFSWNGIKWE
ncbi:DUF3256 family protein [Bacteroidales bacterium OttesenSCG-928-I14]|nr:DUF3256 family protein [Bacteroidales bacterium OttesenSCG-928-I14]